MTTDYSDLPADDNKTKATNGPHNESGLTEIATTNSLFAEGAGGGINQDQKQGKQNTSLFSPHQTCSNPPEQKGIATDGTNTTTKTPIKTKGPGKHFSRKYPRTEQSTPIDVDEEMKLWNIDWNNSIH